MADEENKDSAKKTSKRKSSTRKKTASKKKAVTKRKTAEKKVDEKEATSKKVAADASGGSDSRADKQDKIYDRLEEMDVMRDTVTEPSGTQASSGGLNLRVEFIFLALLVLFLVIFLAVFSDSTSNDQENETAQSEIAVSVPDSGELDASTTSVPVTNEEVDPTVSVEQGMKGHIEEGMITQPGSVASPHDYIPRPGPGDMYRPMGPAGTQGAIAEGSGEGGNAVYDGAYPTPPPMPGYPPYGYYPPYYPPYYQSWGQPWGQSPYQMPMGPANMPPGYPGWRW